MVHADQEYKDLFIEQYSNFSSIGDNYDLVFASISVEIDPAVEFISGIVKHHVITKEDQVAALSFDLHNDFTVTHVSYHGQSLSFDHSDHELEVILSHPLSINTLDSLEITYSGVPPDPGFTGVDFVTSLSGHPMFYTLAEPYSSRDWWPCKQSLTDKIDSVDVIITTPAQYETASNGLLVGVDSTSINEKKIYHWQHRYPIAAYLICAAVSEYITHEEMLDLSDGSQLYYLDIMEKGTLVDLVQNELAVHAKNAIKLFSDLFGKYPFHKEKYGHADFGWNGGIEHQTMTFIYGWEANILVHEAAHQWFGNFITCNSWEDIWLNEGFATYLDWVYSEHLGFGEPLDALQVYAHGAIVSIVSEPDGSVYVDDISDPARIFDLRLSYYKGAMLLHMLRGKLGDEDFYEGVHNFLYDPDHVFGYVSTADLKGKLEQSSGEDLTEFFNDWLYGQGHPIYHLTWDYDNGQLKMKLDQETSHHSVNFFEMPLPIEVRGPNAQDSIVLRLDHTHSGQVFNESVPFEVVEVKFDPYHWVLSSIYENTITEAVVTSANALASPTVKIYPNPGSDRLYVQTDRPLKELKIADIIGRTITTSSFQDSGLYIGDLLSGLYVLSVIYDNGKIENVSFVNK